MKHQGTGGSIAAAFALALCALGVSAAPAFADPPSVTIEPASEVGPTMAKAKGSVNPSGKFTSYRFEYISDEAFQAVTDTIQGVYLFTSEGEFSLSFRGQTTPNLPYNASAAELDSALEALSSIGGAGGSVAVTGGPVEPGYTAFQVHFGGSLGGSEVEGLGLNANFFGFVNYSQTGHAPGFGGAATVGGGTIEGDQPGGPVAANLENLVAGTTYHLRLVAENNDSAGTPTAAVAPNFTTTAAIAPVATVGAASASYVTAHLSGTVDPEGGNTNPGGAQVPIHWELQYSENPVAGWGVAGAGDISGAEATGTTPIPVQADATGLKASTKYFYRLVLSYAGLFAYSAEPDPEFTTLAVEGPKVISVANATDVLNSSAKVSGVVERPADDDPAFDVNCRFEYVTDAQFALTGFDVLSGATACEPDVSKVAGSSPVHTMLGRYPGGDNLAFNTTYHLRLTVSNAGGSDSEVAASTFTTLPPPGPPILTVSSPIEVKARSAHLVGTVDTGGLDPYQETFWHFECTPECQPLGETSLAGTVQPGSSPQPVGADAKLKANTNYEVKLVASNVAAAEGSSAPVSFKTLSTVGALTGGASVNGTSATMTGEVDRGGLASSYHFDLGLTDEYGVSMPTQTLPAGDPKVPVSEPLVELEPGTTYHYRLVVTNSAGTAEGNDRTFTIPSGAAKCPNEAVREQQKATFLTECRAYEIVNSPSDEIGDVNRVPQISDDGNHAAFITVTPGSEATGNSFYSAAVGNRGATGWSVEDANVAPKISLNQRGDQVTLQFSSDFSKALVHTLVAGDPEDDVPGTFDLYRINVGQGTSDWLTKGNGASALIGATPDLSRVSYFNGFAEPWEIWTTTDGTDAEPVSILPDGTPVPGAPAGQAGSWGYPSFSFYSAPTVGDGGTHGMSDDGRRIFFNETINHFPQALYMRDTVEKKTYLISASQRTGEVGQAHLATFIAATHDGEIVYFICDDRLTDEATPGGGIYRYNVVTKALSQVTPATPQGKPLSPTKVMLSDDGTHVYTVTVRALTPGAEGGASNLYVSSGGTTRLVASSPTDIALNRVSRDGRYGLFTSKSSLEGAPNNGNFVLYEYDDEGGSVACVSCRPDGSPSQGGATVDAFSLGWPVGEVNQRAIANDGRVFFMTNDQLLERDETSSLDVYMYDHGAVSLISSGKGDKDVYLGGNTPDGKNVFIETRQSLVPQDVDAEEMDVYNVRVDGGFLQPPPPPTPCQGEECRVGVSKAPPASAPVTPSFIGAGNNRSALNQGPEGSHRKKKHKKKKNKKKKHHRKNGKGRSGR